MSITAIPFPKIEAVTFRELRPDETEKLTPFLKQQGWGIPLPHLAAVVVGEYQGEIVSFAVAQLIPHAEPIYVSPSWRGTGLAEETAKQLAGYMLRAGTGMCLSIAQTKFAEDLCRMLGMVEMQGKIFVRE